MNYNDFLEYIKQGVTDFCGPEMKVTINHIVKNNGIELDGLAIAEEGHNVSPTIYLNSFYEDYKNGAALYEIVKRVVALYEETKLKQNVDVEFFTKFELVRSKLVYKVVNFEKNRELLKLIPYRRILDLAVVYYCLVENDLLGNATILVYNTHMKMWGIDEAALYETAKENTQHLLPAEITEMTDILYEIVNQNMKASMMQEIDAQDSQLMIEELLEEIRQSENAVIMYVLSNKFRLNGAACMLYEDSLKKFARDNRTDLYVIPSSVHEGATRFAA